MDSQRSDDLINVHHIESESYVNGPGKRMVIWVQGCYKFCKGCYNPKTWSFEDKNLYSVDKLFNLIKKIKQEKEIEGITLTGGEQFLQAFNLIKLFKKVKEIGLTIVLFTGFYLQEIQESENAEILNLIDVLKAGPYEIEKKVENVPFTTSSNQKLYFMTNKYSLRDFQEKKVEIIFDNDFNNFKITGFPEPDLLQLLKQFQEGNKYEHVQ